eukprot:scaffold3840_cov159-Isochrysis_galbana.AAC.2
MAQVSRPCPVLPFAREKARQLVSVIVLGVTLATKVPVGPSFLSIPPSVLELRLVNQSINQPQSCQSLHMLAIIARQVTRIRAKSFSPTRPVSRAWFSPSSMINEMFATVHAAGSSLLGLFTSCTTFDSTLMRRLLH